MDQAGDYAAFIFQPPPLRHQFTEHKVTHREPRGSADHDGRGLAGDGSDLSDASRCDRGAVFPGAGGTIGARAVAKAVPDGHTLMVGHSGVFGIAPALYADPGYDPWRDFAPIGSIGGLANAKRVGPASDDTTASLLP